MKKTHLTLFTIFFALAGFAQDKIYKKGGEVIEVKVIESGVDDIKYKLFADPEGPTFTIEKERITKVDYQSGRTEVYQSSLKDPELYADQSRMAVKVNFLSPLFGYTQFNFEKNIRPGRGYELALGIIGLGKRQELDYYSSSSKRVYRDAQGAYLSGGYKFARIPDFANKRAKYMHIMQGSYVKPEVIFGLYSQNYQASSYSSSTPPIYKRETIVFGGLMVNGGKQWVLGDSFLIDIYLGLGYAFDNQNYDDYYGDYEGSHFGLLAAGDSGFGFTSGFKVGLLLNKKKK